MSGVISDGVSSGDVVVQGGGTLIMTGINTYTGLTSVASGTTLSLQGVGSIAQTVSLSNNGVLDLSSLTANASLGGTYTQGSAGTLGMRLTASGAQTLSIAGAASLNGALRLTAQSGTYTSGTYALITAGSVTGSFSTLSTNLGDDVNSYELVYSSTSVSLLIENGPSASNTKMALALNSVNLEQAMMERLLTMQSKLQYDCTTFEKHGVCLSASTRLNGTKTTENGGGILTGAYRISPKWRVGGFVDQELTRHSPRDVRTGVPQPAFGAFVGYNENKNGLGFIARAAASISLGDVVVTRDSSAAAIM
jgi:autotransporter-associated beta strand protein